VKPLISFIMPVYNGAKYLKDSINSIYQTVNTSWELLILDDASTDNSTSVIKMKTGDKRVRAWYSTERAGAAEARNRLIAHSEADVLYMLDCDNILEHDCADKMYYVIGQNSAVATEKIKFFGFKRPQSMFIDNEWVFKIGSMTLQDMLTTHKVPPSSGNYMMKKTVWNEVGGYHKDDVQETWGFGFRHMVKGLGIFVCPGTSYLHRFCRSGYYNELPKDEMAKAYWNRLNDIRELLNDEAKLILDGSRDGKQLIAEGRLKLK
jgi:glycosyltransferase involved in cell wall biosynthesis